MELAGSCGKVMMARCVMNAETSDLDALVCATLALIIVAIPCYRIMRSPRSSNASSTENVPDNFISQTYEPLHYLFGWFFFWKSVTIHSDIRPETRNREEESLADRSGHARDGWPVSKISVSVLV
jgi:hypothetical protein